MNKALVLSALLITVTVLSVSGLDPITVGIFGPSLVDTFATNKGYFTAQNLAPTFAFVSGSVQQFNSLDAGTYDLIETAGDNVVYRRLNQGRTQYITLAEYDGSPGLEMLVNTNLGIHTITDLEGKVIISDSTQSGFVTALREFFHAAGLPEIDDTLLVPSGGLFQRIGHVIDGTANGTMSQGTTTFVTLANNPQVISVDDMVNFVCPYVGNYLVAISSWLYGTSASTNQNKLTRFLRAELQAWAYITNPANQAEVITLIQTSNNVTNAVATQIFNITVASQNVGFNDHLIPRMRGTANGINVRALTLHISPPPCIPTSGLLVSQPNGWFDLSFLFNANLLQLGFTNTYGVYYGYPLAPCE